MPDEKMVLCLRESELDTIEESLKDRMMKHLAKGEFEEADAVEDTIRNLDEIPVC